MKQPHQVPKQGFVAVRVEAVTSQIPSGERWTELREKLPMLPDQPQEVHVVTLITDAGQRVPLWVGSFEGQALKLHVEGIRTERPLTYDLMLQALERHGVRIVRADVVRIVKPTFFAQLTTESQYGEQVLDCRPSDALNLALRAGAPVAIAQGVLDEAGAEDESDETN